jgi:hypothetical protein
MWSNIVFVIFYLTLKQRRNNVCFETSISRRWNNVEMKLIYGRLNDVTKISYQIPCMTIHNTTKHFPIICGQILCLSDFVRRRVLTGKLFTKRGCSSENLPPMRDALIQHIRRAIYQAAWADITQNFHVMRIAN